MLVFIVEIEGRLDHGSEWYGNNSLWFELKKFEKSVQANPFYSNLWEHAIPRLEF